LAASYEVQMLSILPGDGQGGFADFIPLPVAKGPYAVAVHDVDDDGVADIAAVHEGAAEISIMRGLGGGDYAQPVPFPVGLGPLEFALGDLNGDAAVDVVVVNAQSSSVSILLAYP
jgi:hypothetical protein